MILSRSVSLIIPEKSSRLIAIVSHFTLFTCYPALYWSLMGMEVSFLCFLFSCAAYCAVKAKWDKSGMQKYYIRIALLAFVAYLLRPDGPICILCLFFYVFYQARREKWFPKTTICIFAGALAVILAVSLWRYSYYGEIVPNTYTLKMTGYPLSLRITNGLGFMSYFIPWYFCLLVAALICIIKFRPGLTFLFLCFIAIAAYQIYVGGDPWIYWRQLSPGLLALYVLLVVFFADSISHFQK
jgi:hypothetical protein